MQLTSKSKKIGTIEMIAAALIIIFAVIFTTTKADNLDTQPEQTTALIQQESTELSTEPQSTVHVTQEQQNNANSNDYTISNYILVMQNSAMEMYSISKTKLTQYADSINSFAAKVPDKKVYVMLAPTRIAFYGPEEYMSGSHSQPDGMNIVYSNLSPNITCIDAYSSISKHKSEYIYFRTDHHWTARGAYYAYTALCDSIGDSYQPLANYETGEIDNFVGSMYRYTKSEVLANDPDKVEYFMPLNNATGQFFSDATMSDPKPLRIISTNIEDRSSKYMCFIQGDKPLIKITTSNPSGRKILMLKESYGNAMAPFLTENYSEIYVLDPRQDGVANMNLAQFVNDNGINEILFINYMMAPSNSKYMTSLNNIINK